MIIKYNGWFPSKKIHNQRNKYKCGKTCLSTTPELIQETSVGRTLAEQGGSRFANSRMACLSALAMILLSLIPSSTSQSSSIQVRERASCTNSCCQSCTLTTPTTCDTCYRLNTNPSMCPCVGSCSVVSTSF